MTSPREGEIRFTEHNDAQKFYQVAKDVGLLVIVRPGPYVNAETAGGGCYLGFAPSPCLTTVVDRRSPWLDDESARFSKDECNVISICVAPIVCDIDGFIDAR